ncbi:MAG: fasciclin domain-containing protein, partial [Acholeplasmatales bacterium]
MFKRLSVLFSFFALIFVIAACDVRTTDPDPIEDTPEDIVDTAIAAGDFGTLVAALVEAELVEALRAEGPFTVFAPTDAAFAALLEELELSAEELLALENLSEILLYHVLAGAFYAEDVLALVAEGPADVETLSGEFVTLALDGSSVTVNGVAVTVTDIEASNGVIHVIDGVLIPEGEEEPEPLDIVDTAITTEGFETLVAALIAAELVEALRAEGPFTVFAPTDEAFAALLEELEMSAEELLASDILTDVLLYHVVAGAFSAEDVIALTEEGPVEVETLGGAFLTISVESGSVFVNGAEVILADVFASNGIIHVIDGVLIPEGEEEPEPLDIVDTAITTEGFETLVAALIAAELVEALRAEGPFTVFAPTDEAFAALLEELEMSAEELLASDILTDVLLYHVVAGAFSAEDVIALTEEGPVEVETLGGAFLTISVESGSVFVNGAEVILADVFASNGIIHVIDGV